MLIRLILLVLACCLLGPDASSQRVNASGGILIPEQAAYDVQHYELVLSVHPKKKAIGGRLTMRAVALSDVRRLALDLDGRLEVSAVESQGNQVDFEHESGRIWIDLPEVVRRGDEFAIAVSYGGQPRVAPRPPWDGGFTWSKSKGGAPVDCHQLPRRGRRSVVAVQGPPF